MRTGFALQSLVVLFAAVLSARPQIQLLLVVNSDEDTVSVVDLAHPELAEKITTRNHPQDVAVSPDAFVAYVAEMGTEKVPGNTIAVVDLATRRIVRRFVLGHATLPHLLVVSRDGDTLWAACAPQKVVVELDTHSGSVRKAWDTQQEGSYLVAVTPDEKKLYVANFEAGTVSVIRRSDASVIVVQVGGQPIGIDVSPDGNEVWVSNFKSNTIAVINAATDRIVQTFSSGGDGPARLKFTPDGRQVLITQSRSNQLDLFDVAQRRLLRTIPLAGFPKGLLVASDGQHAFVSSMEGNKVTEVDVAAGRVLQRITTGEAPEGLAWVGH